MPGACPLRRVALGALLLLGCSAPFVSRREPAPPDAAVTAPVPSTAPAAPPRVEKTFAPPESARARAEVVRRALFGPTLPAAALACAETVRCLLDVAYAADETARTMVLDLYDRFDTVVIPGEGETMDLSYRGTITVVPVLPIGALRKHLEWLHVAFDSIAVTLRAAEHPVAIRFPAVIGFVRSLHGKRTPSGYALDWRYTYNVEGSLNVSEESVRGVAIHEMFHLVDVDGNRTWSEGAFGDDVRSIVARCHGDTACLTPFSPTRLRVRGGTFYAFQPGNDIVAEYAAELATRVLEEQRGRLGAGPKLAPFKCGPAPNAKTWEAVVHRYFGDLDHVPACAVGK